VEEVVSAEEMVNSVPSEIQEQLEVVSLWSVLLMLTPTTLEVQEIQNGQAYMHSHILIQLEEGEEEDTGEEEVVPLVKEVVVAPLL